MVVVLSRLLLIGRPSLLRTITPITLGVSWHKTFKQVNVVSDDRDPLDDVRHLLAALDDAVAGHGRAGPHRHPPLGAALPRGHVKRSAISDIQYVINYKDYVLS